MANFYFSYVFESTGKPYLKLISLIILREFSGRNWLIRYNVQEVVFLI